ncbi:MAG: hypothetical protein WAT79_03875 [Saprospiraceae bacterium]
MSNHFWPERIKPRINYYVHGDLGFMFDRYDKLDKFIIQKARSEKYILKSGTDYFGFSPVIFGVSKTRNQKITEVNIEWINLKSQYLIDDIFHMVTVGASRNLRSLTVNYFASVFYGGKKNTFNVGSNIGVGYARNFTKNLNYGLSWFDRSISCICFGIDVKAIYQLIINKFWRINFSTKLVLLDVGYINERKIDLNFPIKYQYTFQGFRAEIWRNQYPFTVGIAYKIK